jgi:DnaJ-domain-containing protein 1
MDDPFHTLGLPRRFDLTPAEISAAHRRSVARLHPDRATDLFERDRLLHLCSEAGAAKQRLLNDVMRAEALLALLGGAAHGATQPSPAFLMETLELREEIDAAMDASPGGPGGSPGDRVTGLEAKVTELRGECIAALARAFATDPADLAGAGEGLVRLRYLDRMVASLQA